MTLQTVAPSLLPLPFSPAIASETAEAFERMRRVVPPL